MPRHRRFELDELANRPGTYFNPQTEVLVVVDDNADVDQEIFGSEELEGDEEWVLVSDVVPIDESARDELLERFQVSSQQGSRGSGSIADELEDELAEDEELAEE